MSLVKKVKAVEKIFAHLDEQIQQFQANSSLQCHSACGKCCFKSDIEATPLEFLPFAYHAFIEGKAEVYYDKLVSQPQQVNCTILTPFLSSEKGFCTSYAHRGLICRLFGFTAMKKDTGLQIVTCKHIKENQAEAFEQATKKINTKELEIPLASDYGYQLMLIDNVLGNKRVHINEAIKISLEYVLSYYAYRKPPKKAAV